MNNRLEWQILQQSEFIGNLSKDENYKNNQVEMLEWKS